MAAVPLPLYPEKGGRAKNLPGARYPPLLILIFLRRPRPRSLPPSLPAPPSSSSHLPLCASQSARWGDLRSLPRDISGNRSPGRCFAAGSRRNRNGKV